MNIVNFQSNTSKWSLVIHRVSSTSVTLWAGTLFTNMGKPKQARLIVKQGDTVIETIEINDWTKPFKKLNQRFVYTTEVSGLNPGSEYQVYFYKRLEGPDFDGTDSWHCLKKGAFSTLPVSLPDDSTKPFTVSLSSCFYIHKDNGRAAAAFKGLYENGLQKWQPDIKFMVGDQVYLDIGLDSLSPVIKEVRERIADDYAENWRELGSMLCRGGTWMLPDDHEYWNDYPFYDSLLPTLFMLKIGKIRNAWRATAKEAVENVQQSRLVETFSIGNDISFCIANTRSSRSQSQFMSQAGLNEVIEWAKQLSTPGVLVLSQVLFAKHNNNERNLRSFKKQYGLLIKALANAAHDIVVLSGDVHFGRIAQVSLGDNGRRIIEVTSSPLSNLTGLNSVATSTADLKPKSFPPNDISEMIGIEPKPIEYKKELKVSGYGSSVLNGYLRQRTKEHFMTVGFSKENDQICMQVQAWRIRQVDSQGVPKSDFKVPFIEYLN